MIRRSSLLSAQIFELRYLTQEDTVCLTCHFRVNTLQSPFLHYFQNNSSSILIYTNNVQSNLVISIEIKQWRRLENDIARSETPQQESFQNEFQTLQTDRKLLGTSRHERLGIVGHLVHSPND